MKLVIALIAIVGVAMLGGYGLSLVFPTDVANGLAALWGFAVGIGGITWYLEVSG